MNPTDRINSKQACERYSISRSTLTRMVKRGTIPKPHRVSYKIINWDKSALDLVFFGAE